MKTLPFDIVTLPFDIVSHPINKKYGRVTIGDNSKKVQSILEPGERIVFDFYAPRTEYFVPADNGGGDGKSSQFIPAIQNDALLSLMQYALSLKKLRR